MIYFASYISLFIYDRHFIGKSIWSFRNFQFFFKCVRCAWMDGQPKEDAYICDHLEKFELATLSSHVDVEIFVFLAIVD